MQSPFPKHSNPWPWVAGACAVLTLFACGIMMLVGAGGALFFSRMASEKSHVEFVNRSEAIPAATQAELQDLRGLVEVQDEDGRWFPAQPGEWITAGQRVRTGSLSGAALVFHDGSRATLLSNAELSIDELDAPKNAPRSIVMTQWAGESEHDVAANKRKGSRYEVNTPAGTGTAMGTVFHVVVTPDQKAYYYVLEGAVSVTSLQVTVTVSAGEVTTILLGQPPLEPVLYVSGEGLVSQVGEVWIINGQEFKVTEDTTIAGNPQVGDWALVKGRILEDETLVADWIILVRSAPANRFNLTGIVEATGETEWQVNGQAITVTTETEIEDGIQVGDTVRVEGLVQTNGTLTATTIEKVDEDGSQPFDFTGVVTTLGADAWVVSGVTVAIDENTATPKDVMAGALVRVKGIILSDGQWLAVSITLVEETAGSFSFTGELESMNPWKVAGISFETRNWTEIEDGLAAGDLVRVKGRIDEAGLWIADEIEKVDGELSTLALVGTVLSVDPWVVSGYPLTVTDATLIDGEITVGMLVRVEILIQADGAWQIVSITPLPSAGWFPGCMEVVATVVSVDGSQLVLQGWPVLTLGEDVQVDGMLAPNSVIRFQLCFNEDMTIHIVYIIIIEQVDLPDPIYEDEGGKVTICHKPGKKKGGNTLSISRSALGAHLGHGDYEGPCR